MKLNFDKKNDFRLVCLSGAEFLTTDIMYSL